jgi:hypothetical protein
MAMAMVKKQRIRSSGNSRRTIWLRRVPARRFFVGIAISALAIFASVIAIRTSAPEVLGGVYPEVGLSWAPSNARVNAIVAQRLIAAGRLNEGRQFANLAINRDPTTVAAFTALALAAEAQGNREQATYLFGVAHTLSRRDRVTETWLLRDALRAGQYEQAVRHLDILIRVSTRGEEQLIPLLVAATGDPRIVPPLRQQLARAPIWKMAFMRYLVSVSAAAPPESMVALSRGLLDPADADEGRVLRLMIQRLADLHRYDLAWTMYREAKPGAALPNGPWQDSDFGAHDYPPFDWWLADQPEFSAMRGNRPDGRPGQALILLAGGGQRGAIARRILRLNPGSYAIEYDAGDIPAEPIERPQVSMSCGDPEAAFFTSRPEIGGEASRHLQGRFIVPSNCAWQSIWISVAAAGDDDQSSPPWIANLSIRQAN